MALNDMYVGVPTVIGENGVEKVIEIDLDKTEQKAFDNSVASVAGSGARPARKSIAPDPAANGSAALPR
jgi:malate/lactate dehydrogenase